MNNFANILTVCFLVFYLITIKLQIDFIRRYKELIRNLIFQHRGVSYNPDPSFNLQQSISSSIFSVRSQSAFILFLDRFFKRPENVDIKKGVPLEAFSIMKKWKYLLMLSVCCLVLAFISTLI